MNSVAMFRLRLVIENALFAALLIGLWVARPVWWIAVIAVAGYVGAAMLLHRLIPPPARRP
jgi:hypothetical protein